jgi:hypothetical protein
MYIILGARGKKKIKCTQVYSCWFFKHCICMYVLCVCVCVCVCVTKALNMERIIFTLLLLSVR